MITATLEGNDHVARRPAMYHPETAYTFAKQRQEQLERAALEGSPLVALLTRLVKRG